MQQSFMDPGESGRRPLVLVGLLIVFAAVLLFMFLGLGIGSTYTLNAESLLGILVVVAMIGHATIRVIKRDSGKALFIDLSYPPTLYGIFFVMYHLMPYLLAVTAGIIPVRNHLPIAFLLFLGYVGWIIGVRLSRVSPRKKIAADFFKSSDAKALFITALIAAALVGLLWGMKIARGQFYAHGGEVQTEKTMEFSFFYVFVQTLQFPTLLVLGFLAHHSDPSIGTLARRVFYGYAATLFLTLMLASWTRGSLTVLLFTFMSLGLHQKFHLRLIHAIVLVFLGGASILVVQGLRMDSSVASSDNQLGYTFTHLFSHGFGNALQSTSDVADSVYGRTTHGVEFLSDLLDALENQSYLYGAGIMEAGGIVVPRVIWPDKPLILPYDNTIEAMLGLYDHDTAETPICQFYAEFGYFGVIAGHILLGWFIGRVFYHLAIRPQVFVLLLFFFLWSNLSNLEWEAVIESLQSLRSMILFYATYRLVRSFVSDSPEPLSTSVATSRIQTDRMAVHSTQ